MIFVSDFYFGKSIILVLSIKKHEAKALLRDTTFFVFGQ